MEEEKAKESPAQGKPRKISGYEKYKEGYVKPATSPVPNPPKSMGMRYQAWSPQKENHPRLKKSQSSKLASMPSAHQKSSTSNFPSNPKK